ncbi:MAG: amino acid decarboxylase [Clostridia bacterium]|nr:amino acid decarboxylase [Clostridia bacterium]
METPICDYVKAYADSDALRLHMPGHKGKSYLGMESLDITEIDGADVLYASEGIILKSEENAAYLFDTARTVYSAEGSSLSIRAMLYLAVLYGKKNGKRPLIAAARNAHKTFLTAAALLDLDVHWLYGEEAGNILSCVLTAEILEKELSAMLEKPVAVYITSPDYLGNTVDIASLSRICRRYGILLLVDNAHGAYLHFLPESGHPIALGAAMCCDSAHKTLPVLTGGGYLHISKNAPEMFCEMAERAMSLFASTSPSYLILQSLDRANAYIADGYREKLAGFIPKVRAWKEQLHRQGFVLTGDEEIKVTIAPKSYGYTGTELAEILQSRNIHCEFADPDYLVLMCTPETGENGLRRAAEVFAAIEKRTPITDMPPKIPRGQQTVSIREAALSPFCTIPVENSKGRILAAPSVNCPPAVPIVVSGEMIDEEAIRCFRYYGIAFCDVME